MEHFLNMLLSADPKLCVQPLDFFFNENRYKGFSITDLRDLVPFETLRQSHAGLSP